MIAGASCQKLPSLCHLSNDPNALNWEQFAQHIQTSLNALYDYAALHANPAVHLLTAANPADQDEVEHFRDLISEAVEKLRPDASLPLTARSARPYHILRMRYIEQHDIPRILYQLALSKRQFYRENAKAIEAITLILWERVAPPDAPPIAAQSAPQATLHSEIHRVSGSSGQVDLSQLVAGVLESVAALASRRGIALSVAAGQDQAVLIYTDRVLLRQTLLVLLSHLLTHAAGTIELAWSGDGIAVTIQPPLEDTALPPNSTR
jgi:signal transduction histidine kinase